MYLNFDIQLVSIKLIISIPNNVKPFLLHFKNKILNCYLIFKYYHRERRLILNNEIICNIDACDMMLYKLKWEGFNNDKASKKKK